jgi:cyclopropane fatty-acyl-phospholipid synthase-like methyltransferase
MPASWTQFWKQHPDEPISQVEKLKLLRRAYDLGNERERIVNEYADRPIVSLGMFNHFKTNGLSPWQQTIKQELEKEGITVGADPKQK